MNEDIKDIDALNLVFLDDLNYQKMAAAWRTVQNKEKYNVTEWAKAAGMQKSVAEIIAHVLITNNICNENGIAPLAYNYLHNIISTKLLKK